MGFRKPKPQPTPVNSSLPPISNVQKLPGLEKPEAKGGTGVPDSYKQSAKQGGNVMWRAKVKGRKVLAGDIPLHMSLKTFDKPEDIPHEEVAQKVNELGLQRPDPNKLKYEPTTFTSQRNGQTYYMLKLHGHDPAYDQFVDHFKGRGITYPSFMGHITIDKELHDQIKKEGIQPHEVEFSPLMIEHGANNPTHLFPDASSHKDATSDITPKKLNPVSQEIDTGNVVPIGSAKPKKLAASECMYTNMQKTAYEHFETLEKGIGRNIGAAAAVIGSLAGSPNLAAAPHLTSQQNKVATQNQSSNFHNKVKNAIGTVESTGGKFTNHAQTPHGSAYGKYALMPDTIKETVKVHPDLKRVHSKALMLNGNDLHHYMQDNPQLEEQITDRHIERLRHHFGDDPAKLGFAWINGIRGTNKALNNKADINNHWHVQKVIHAYNKGK